MLAAAVDDERIAQPREGCSPREGRDHSARTAHGDEVRDIAHATVDHVRGAVVLAAGTGLRQGELFGLTVDRVDFMRRELRVDRQLWTPSKGSPILKSPKSANSHRTIALTRSWSTLSPPISRRSAPARMA